MIPITKPTIGDEEIAAAAEAWRTGWVSQGPGSNRPSPPRSAPSTPAPFPTAPRPCIWRCWPSASSLATKSSPSAIRSSRPRTAFAIAAPFRYSWTSCRRLQSRSRSDRSRDHRADPSHSLRASDRSALRSARNSCRCRPAWPPVIEDAACAIGSEIRVDDHWERIGKPHGHIACFSFHPRKVITTGEGGMLTTSNAGWDQRFRLLRQHCMSVPDTTRHGSAQVIFEAYPDLGFNYRMTDIQAAVGCEQLKRLPEIFARRWELAVRYQLLLAAIPGLGVPVEPDWARSNWQSFCVRLPEGRDQRQVMQSMLDAGVATRRGIMCSHREAAYPPGTWSCGIEPGGCECAAGCCQRLRQSEDAQDRTLILPLFPQMSFEQQDQIVAALFGALGG